MARPLRIERAGGWYHITARGNERKLIYRDDRDCTHFLELLAQMVERFNVRLHAYVLMGNHYHLLLELREANLSRAVQWLNVSYSVWFNRRHSRTGHLLQGRFKSVLVSREEWGLRLSRYIHLNPVRLQKLGLNKSQQQRIRAGVAGAPNPDVVKERIATLRAHRWSSYRSYLGLAAKPEWLECDEILSLGGGRKGEEQRRYREYVEMAVREGLEKSPWEELREQVVLGSQEFLTRLRAGKLFNERERRMIQRLTKARPDFARIVDTVEKIKGEKWTAFRERHGDSGRDLVLYPGRKEGGLKLDELAQAAGMKGDASVAVSLRRYAARLDRDKMEQKRCKEASQLLGVRM